jgi:hypothetical protein
MYGSAKTGEDTGMKKRSLLAVPVLLASLLAHGQAAPSPGQKIQGPGPDTSSDSNADKKEAKLGNYHLVITYWAPGSTTHLLSPQPVVELKTANPRTPGDVSGTVPIPDQSVFEAVAKPSYECTPTTPVGRGCESLDIARITSTDPKTISYRFTNHGPAVRMAMNVEVRDLALRSQEQAEQEWHPNEVIFVSVPKPTPSFNVVSATVIGVWDNNAIVFEPGKPLSAAAKKGIDDLNIRQDLGDKILYSYKVREPKASK